MKWCALLFTTAFLTTAGPGAAAQNLAHSHPIFKHALDDIRGRTTIPILLPTTLPAAIRTSAIKLAEGSATQHGYQISLYYGENTNASFAVYFSGTEDALPELPNTQAVKLAHGTAGIFRPVSCGGSCAPANLWWRENGATYHLQVKLDSAMPEPRQEKILVGIANSSVVVR